MFVDEFLVHCGEAMVVRKRRWACQVCNVLMPFAFWPRREPQPVTAVPV